MTVPEILKELELYTGRFPMEAMKAAVEQREAITPELLRALEAVADDPAGWAARPDAMLHTFGVFLLAQFREKRAYPLLARIISAPGEIVFDLYGDAVTEALGELFASVYDGDPAPLERLVESEEANEFARAGAFDAFLALERSGQMSREAVAAYFQRLFAGGLKRNPSYVWSSLACAVADLPAPELLAELRWAFDEGLADPDVASLEGLERDLREPKELRPDQSPVITDAIAEMEWWAAFHPDETTPEEVPDPDPEPGPFVYSPRAAPREYVPPQPYIRPPKIGRNDPCPCGSGKKYKKCCGKA
jgi:hypothetical protein